MSCSFWLIRKRKAAQRRKQEAMAAPVEVKAEPAEKKPVKKAVKAENDPTTD